MGLTIGDEPVVPGVQSIAEPESAPTAAAPKKQTELSAILAQIRKEKGDKVVVNGRQVPKIKRLPTGNFDFDFATGGGFPLSRISNVYGLEGSGKTALCYMAIAQAQRQPPPCNKAVYIDLEHTIDPVWAAMFGIDLDELVLVQPAYGEEAVDLIDALVYAEDVALIVVDSIANLVAIKEVEQSSEKYDVGTTSILAKRMINKLVIALTKEERRGHQPAVVFINQIRYKIGVMFGNPEICPGGKAKDFAYSLSVRLSAKNKIVKEISPDVPAFKETTAEIKKAKVPVIKTSFGYDMCVYPHNGLMVGQVNSWNTVANHLKQLGILQKVSAGWLLQNKLYKTLVPIQDTYEAEPHFALELQRLVIEAFKDKMTFVEQEQ